MDPRPIGIFDSGLGGLTGAKALREMLPGEDLIYFGDSANAPYGTRSRAELLALAGSNIAFLQSFDVKAILVACGTVSSTVLGTLRTRPGTPALFDVVEAACVTAAGSGARRVAVTATEATIRSGAFPRRLRELAPELEIFSKPCQSLVTTVEQGHFRAGDPVAEAAVASELEAVRAFRPELVLLACTHFPLLSDSIASYLGPDVRLLSVSAEAAAALARDLRQRGACAGRKTGLTRWFTSGEITEFARLSGLFLGHTILPERHVNPMERN